jgi:hypothetical protein
MLTIHAVIAGVLAVLSLGRVRRIVAVSVTAVLVFGVVVPQPVQAQLGLGGLSGAIRGVLNTINGALRGLFDTANSLLGQISGVMQGFRNLMETIVYPQTLVLRAQGMVSSMIAQFRGLLSSIFNIGVGSASLPNPTSLEAVVRNRNCGDFSALSQAYSQTYRTVPPATDADPMDRNLIDMDDATALAQLKTLKEADAVSDQMIAASMLMEDEAQQVAPGTADYMVAAGLIAAVQNQAVMQKMIASAMRQEAARLAHQNMIRKRNAMVGSQIRGNLGDLLRRR